MQGDQTSQSLKESTLDVHWKDWCWSWNSSTLATWSKELTLWKRPWFWERLKAGGEWEDRGWDGWMASLIQWTWVRASSGSWWWMGKPGMLQSMGSQRIRCDWGAKLNWTVCPVLSEALEIDWWTTTKKDPCPYGACVLAGEVCQQAVNIICK